MIGERIQIYHNKRAIIGPPDKQRFAGVPIVAQPWMLVLQLCDFIQGGGSGPPAPLWIRPCLNTL